MISERQLASGFHSFWVQLLPLLTPEYLRAFNGAYRTRLDAFGIPIRELPLSDDVRHHDVISEVTFHIARQSVQQKVDLKEAFESESVRTAAIARTAELLADFHSDASSFTLFAEEWEEVQRLLNRYAAFFASEDISQFEFEPTFRGLGFVNQCIGDLSVGNTLFEVKTVARGVQAKDLRQLLLYFALQAATGDRRWMFGGFFNPRRALVYTFAIEDIVQDVSGGRIATEVFAEIAAFLTSSDMHFDSSF